MANTELELSQSVSEAIELINSLERQADVSESVASDFRWQQAEQVHLVLQQPGMTQQKLADSWMKADGTPYSRQHVQIVAKAWETSCHLGGNTRPRWNDVYHSPEVRGMAHVSHNSGDNEWFTPPEYIKAARRVMGGIDLDPASTPEANTVVEAETFFTVEDNGLSKSWEGRVWMNPPYARPTIDGFCAKLAEEYADGHVTEACVLVNNATDTGWFHALAQVASSICFTRGRVRFWHPDKESAAAPLQGQAILYFGNHIEEFRNEFLQFGFTAVM